MKSWQQFKQNHLKEEDMKILSVEKKSEEGEYGEIKSYDIEFSASLFLIPLILVFLVLTLMKIWI